MELTSCVNEINQILIDNSKVMKTLENYYIDDEFRQSMKEFNNDMDEKRLKLGESLIQLKTNSKRVISDFSKSLADCHSYHECQTKYNALNMESLGGRTDIKRNAEYKIFKCALVGKNTNAATGNDSDIEEVSDSMGAGGSTFSMYDPWSKALMTDPVRNSKCGHHYDRNTVMAAIKNNLSVRCPYSGCASKTYIQPNHLVNDFELLHKIQAYKAEQENLRYSSDEEDDDN